MDNKKRQVFSDDMLYRTDSFLSKLNMIECKIGDCTFVNQGLFILVTAYFEDSIREIFRIVLLKFPEKMIGNSCTLSRQQICLVASQGHSVIVDNELYAIFKDGVRSQLENLLKIVFNKEYSKSSKKSITKYEKESIQKLEEISLYRNALIHNGGKVTVDIKEKAKYFVPTKSDCINFDKGLICDFFQVYREFFKYLNDEINKSYKPSSKLSQVDKAKQLWANCFSSSLLNFDDYWSFDIEKDLITGIKYPDCEDSISSSEKVLLSIWRHQFNDSIKVESFLLCSINYHKIYELYKGLDDLKFYLMLENSSYLLNL